MKMPPSLKRVGFAFAALAALYGQALASTSDAAKASAVDYSIEHAIIPGDSPSVIVEKAAKVLPRPNQTEWMRLERTFFLHFGPNAFRGVEWGNGRESPSTAGSGPRTNAPKVPLN